MEYSDSYLRSQLPDREPPRQFVPGDVLREIASWIEHGDFDNRPLLARSTQWTYAIFSEMALGNFTWLGRRPHWLPFPWGIVTSDIASRIIVGLYDPHAETAGFGLSLNLPGWEGPSFHLAGEIHFPRLEQTFPFALRTVTSVLHAPNPVTATTTCRARCNTTNAWGIVTAAHAIGTSVTGAAVPLDDGQTGLLLRSFWQPIDAAFVLTGNPQPLPAPLPILDFPAAGLPMTVECKHGPEPRRVASACNSLGFYRTRQYEINFFLDRPCQHGDSGALVRFTDGRATGIYCGEQPSPDTGGTSGRALNFAQAMFALDTTPYR